LTAADIHVTDICEAHLLAAERLMSGCDSVVYNLGNGEGFSVQEIIDVARAVTGRRIPMVGGARREGDPARLVADSTRAMSELGWRPRLADMRTILEHAWNWERKTVG